MIEWAKMGREILARNTTMSSLERVLMEADVDALEKKAVAVQNSLPAHERTIASERFFEDFFILSTVAGVEKHYKYTDEEAKEMYVDREPPYKTAQLTDHFGNIFDAYVRKVGRPLSDQVTTRMVGLAQNYTNMTPKHVEYCHNPKTALEYSKLAALIRHPEFIADPSAVAVMEALADLKYSQPWNFNMFVYWGKLDGSLFT